MSRIGKQPVTVPDNVQIELSKTEIKVKGPKGELNLAIPDKIKVEQQDGELTVVPQGNSKQVSMLYGTIRSLINNMVIGVTNGYEKQLELRGVGYRVAKEGNNLVFNIGYKHPIEYNIPEDVEIDVPDATHITVTGIDKQRVGMCASEIRDLRPPEVYKGHGIRYIDEQVRLKEIKTGAK